MAAGRPDIRGVDPAVGTDEAVLGLGDDHAALHPDDAAGLAQDDLDLARVAVPARSERDGLRTGLDRVKVDDRALGLRDDLLGDDEDVVGRGAAGGRPSPRSRRRSAGRDRRPAEISGMPPSAIASTRPVSAARDAREPGSRVPRGAPAGTSADIDRLADRRRSGDCPRRGAGRPGCRGRGPAGRRGRRAPRRRSRAAASWAIALSPPKQSSIASGGAISRAFVPRPWRSGTIATSGRARLVERWPRRRRSRPRSPPAGRSAGSGSRSRRRRAPPPARRSARG